MLRRRPWSLRDGRRCTTSAGRRMPRYSTSTSDASVLAPLDSLIAYGERVLRSPEPADKVALTLECHQLWRSGSLPIYTGAVWASNPPDQPARSAKPPLFTPKLMPSPKDMDASIPVIMLHALGHIELGAIDNYWDTLVRFDPATYKLPKSFYDDFLTVASDEARHFKMVDDRLRELGSYYGALPATRALLEHAANTTAALAARIAVVPLVQEARGLDSGDRLVHKLQSMGDKPSARVVAQIVHEERSHVSFGIKWFRHLCAHVVDPPCDPVPLFHELVLQYFPDGLPGPFDMEARLAADMEAAWYQPLEAKPRQQHGATAKSSTATSAATQTVDTEAATSARLRAFAAAKKKIILTGSVWPERTSSAAGVRSCDLIEIFQSNGYHVICVSPSRLNAHTETLARDHDVQCVQADANSDTFPKLLQELAPQIVVFDRFIAEEMYGWQAKKYAPSAMRVLDLQDVHFLRRARELLVKKHQVPFAETLDFLTLQLDAAGAELEKPVIRELASIHRSDLTLFVSDVERDALTSRFQIPASLLHRCDFFYPPVPALREMKSYDQRQDIAFIGSFKHAPNVDGIEWLKREVMPVFRNEFQQSCQADPAMPEIHIYGSYSQDAKKYKALHDPKNGFKLMGFAPDVHETLREYRLSVAPLRFGAGIKGKIADSWFNGTPCVATSIGAEGMYMNGTGDAWGGLVADEPAAFARAMRDLYVDPARWLGAQQRGVEICTSRYDKTRNATALMARLEQALLQQETQRRENWVGRILWSEKYRATEFMSRFIRLKNEKS